MNLSREVCIARLSKALEVEPSYFDGIALDELRYLALTYCEECE